MTTKKALLVLDEDLNIINHALPETPEELTEMSRRLRKDLPGNCFVHTCHDIDHAARWLPGGDLEGEPYRFPSFPPAGEPIEEYYDDKVFLLQLAYDLILFVLFLVGVVVIYYIFEAP